MRDGAAERPAEDEADLRHAVPSTLSSPGRSHRPVAVEGERIEVDLGAADGLGAPGLDRRGSSAAPFPRRSRRRRRLAEGAASRRRHKSRTGRRGPDRRIPGRGRRRLDDQARRPRVDVARLAPWIASVPPPVRADTRPAGERPVASKLAAVSIEPVATERPPPPIAVQPKPGIQPGTPDTF